MVPCYLLSRSLRLWIWFWSSITSANFPIKSWLSTLRLLLSFSVEIRLSVSLSTSSLRWSARFRSSYSSLLASKSYSSKARAFLRHSSQSFRSCLSCSRSRSFSASSILLFETWLLWVVSRLSLDRASRVALSSFNNCYRSASICSYLSRHISASSCSDLFLVLNS